jgi:hypothetical protein
MLNLSRWNCASQPLAVAIALVSLYLGFLATVSRLWYGQ